MSTQNHADPVAELRADFAELVECAEAAVHEWDYRCTAVGVHPDDVPKVARRIGSLRALLAKHKAAQAAGPVQADRVPLADEQLDAAVAAWFREDTQPGHQPFAKRMRAAIEAAQRRPSADAISGRRRRSACMSLVRPMFPRR